MSERAGAPYAPFMREEQAGDEDLVREAGELAEVLDGLDDATRARAEGRLGEILRTLGRPAEAETHLRSALEAAVGAAEAGAEVANRLRLGAALQYQERHEDALAELEAAEAAIVEHGLDEDYADFLAQHRGKCLVEMGRVDEGVAELERALELREHKGDPELLAATDVAVEIARELQ